jgi:hypothetical protein
LRLLSSRCSLLIDAINGDQWQAQIALSGKQAMECRLVGYAATHDSGPITVVRETQPVEPGSPPGTEVSLEPDFVVFSNSNSDSTSNSNSTSFAC